MAYNFELSMSKLYEICHLPKNSSFEEIKEIYQIFHDDFTKKQQLDQLENTAIIMQNCAFIQILQMKQEEEEKLNAQKRLNPEAPEFVPLSQKSKRIFSVYFKFITFFTLGTDVLSVYEKPRQNPYFQLMTDLLSNERQPTKPESFSLNTTQNADQNGINLQFGIIFPQLYFLMPLQFSF